MSSTTKRWMQEELRQLLLQRDRYALAEATARDPAQARRRTQRLAVVDEEILGRREALDALVDEPVVRRRPPTRPVRRPPTAAMPPIGASLAVMRPPSSFRVALAKTVGGSFAAGFAMTAAFVWSMTPAPSVAVRSSTPPASAAAAATNVAASAPRDRATARRNATLRSDVRNDDAVLTATAKRRR